MEIASQELGRLAPRAKAGDLDALADAMNRFFAPEGLITPIRVCHFLAQAAHESAGFTAFVENLNYSAQALTAVFGKYFTAQEAEAYARQPEKIANRVYANRMGNGDEASGDGWTYRGRGIFQMTGKENYAKFGARIGVDLVGSPDLAAPAPDNVRLALAYWNDHGLSALADQDDIQTITKRINGGLNGLDDREALLAKAKTIWT